MTGGRILPPRALNAGGNMGLLDQIVGGVLGGQAQGGTAAGGLGGLGGLLSGLAGGSSKGGGAALITALLPVLLGMLANRAGGTSNAGSGNVLEGLLQQFKAAGLGAQADSWVSSGPNLPVSADDLARVFGRDQISQVATQAGMSEDEAANGLASVLPEFVNQLTPAGQVPPQGQLDDALSALQRSLGI